MVSNIQMNKEHDMALAEQAQECGSHAEEAMNKEQNMALVDLALSKRDGFIWFLKGWMSNEYHEEMAKAARVDLNYSEEGRKLLKEFDARLDKGQDHRV